MTFRKAAFSLAVLLLSSASFVLAQGTYTQFDVPGASGVGTQPFGIDSAGDVVGYYEDASGNNHGFLLSNGIYTTIDYPGSIGPTFAFGINDLGQIVGDTTVSGGTTVAFIYDVDRGTFKTFSYPGSPQTFATEINNLGVIVGYYYQEEGNTSVPIGFEYKNGTFLQVLPYGWFDSDLSGINNLGEAVGGGIGVKQPGYFLFKYGEFRKQNIPAPSASANGINDAGALAGSYLQSGVFMGFVYADGTLQTLAFPGSTGTGASDINNSGEVVGGFTVGNNFGHGFTWTPPAEPDKK
jgi:probable HAF family extracellular repeat protein